MPSSNKINKIKQMKKIFAIAGLFFAAMTASAQGTLGEGNLQLNAGVGLSGWGVPVYVGLDYGITEDITVGGEISYRSHSENWGYGKWKHTGIGFFANGNYHFNRILNIPSEIDFYAGLSLGFYNWTTKYDGEGSLSYGGSLNSGLGFAGQIGGRYFFTDQFGINLEFNGGSTTGGKLGITYKF